MQLPLEPLRLQRSSSQSQGRRHWAEYLRFKGSRDAPGVSGQPGILHTPSWQQ